MLLFGKIHARRARLLAIFTVLLLCAVAFAAKNYQSYIYRGAGVPAEIAMSSKLTKLFSKTKMVCFGRYVLEVPAEARIIFGYQEFPAKIITHREQGQHIKELADTFIAEMKGEDPTADVAYFDQGPVPNSLRLKFFAGAFEKKINALAVRDFVRAGNHVFEYGWASGSSEPLDKVIKRMDDIAHNLRVRDNAEVPNGPGVCIDAGFIADKNGADQEIFGAGLYFPTIPDLRFSMMSNKDASTEGPNGVGLIERHKSAMNEQGIVFPRFSEMARLRMGNHIVNGWNGEEVLLRHNGKGGASAHEFLWAFVGKTGDVTKPASVDIQLDTGVDADTKFATRSSLTDDEAIAIWDKLVAGIHFRK